MELKQWKRREMRTLRKQSGLCSLPGQLTASAALLAKARSDRADFIRGFWGHSLVPLGDRSCGRRGQEVAPLGRKHSPFPNSGQSPIASSSFHSYV